MAAEDEVSDVAPQRREPTYLGDGVYATYDGYQIWLAVQGCKIALEPEVTGSLLKYARSLPGWHLP